MKSEQHVWDEIYRSVFEAILKFESGALDGIRDMEKIDKVINDSGYAYLYRKNGGGSSGQFEKMRCVAKETLHVLNPSTIHQNTLASIDSKFAEKMKYAIENHLNKVNEGDRKYVGNTMKTVDKTITVADDSGAITTIETQETVPLTADELMQLNHPKLQGLKEQYQAELEIYKNKMLSNEQIKLSDEQKKNIENMNVTQFLGYTGSVGEYKGALSDHQESMKTFMLMADIGIAIGATLLAPCTGGVSLGVAAGYFIGKATYGIATGKSAFVGEKLSNEDKAWLLFDAATSVLAAGAAIKALSKGNKVLHAISKTAVVGDHTMNFVQAGMLGETGVKQLQKGDVIGGVTLLGLAALGARGTTKATSKVVGEVEENTTKAVNKTSLAAERMKRFVDKVEGLKIKGVNAFDNVSVKFADAMRSGNNLAFAGAEGSLGKNLSHADDLVGRTVARVEGAVDGQLDDVVESVEKIHPTYDEAIKTQFKNAKFPPSEKMYNDYIEMYNNPKYFDSATGNFIFPPNNGAVEGTTKIVTAEVGQIVDRYGFNPESGQFFGRVGDSFESRSLPPSNNPKYGGAQYTKYKVLRPFEWEEGEIASWFNQPGGGKQWYVDVEKGATILNDDGVEISATLKNLKDYGYIEIIND